MRALLNSGLFACGLLLLAACFGPTAAEEIRYHLPVVELDPAADSTSASSAPRELRLRRVSSASSIRERIQWRDGEGRIGYWALDRWAERPVDVLERALSRVLFEQHGLQRSEAVTAQALDVELTAFELQRGAEGQDAARVAMVARLYEHSGGLALYERTLERTVPLGGGEPGAELSAALGQALVQLSIELAGAIDAVAAPGS